MLKPGDLLQQRYQIVRPVSAGGMATVFLAVDMRLGQRQLAIKEMDPDYLPAADRGWAVSAFQQEAQMLATLSHPRLAAVSDFFGEGGYWYLVMEYVEGETLAAALARHGPFGAAQVLGWAQQLADVLAYLHRQQPPIVFRDLKPANVMVQANGNLKLIDFGIARFFKPGQSTDTVRMGTPGYAAPEQYGRGQTDPRSDIYSLGVVVHQLLTGYDPAATPMHLPPADKVNPQVSPAVAHSIERAMALDPARRFPSAGAFVADLAQAAGGSPSPAASARGRLRYLLFAAAVLVFVALAFLFLRNGVGRSAAEAEPTAAATIPAASADEVVAAEPVVATVAATAAVNGETPAPSPTALPPATATASPLPTATMSLASSAVREPADAAMLSPARLSALPRYRSGNGGVLFAYPAAGAVTVDGDLAEWGTTTYPLRDVVFGLEAWRDAADLSGLLQVVWDETYLYLAVQARDDRHVQERYGRNLYLGDSIELQFDSDLQADYDDDSFSSDDFQIGLSPGNFNDLAAEVYLWRPDEAPAPIPVRARRTGDGYIVEVAVPWSLLGVTPGDGAGFGFTVCLSDNDLPGTSEQQTMACSTAARQWLVATSMGTLVLVAP